MATNVTPLQDSQLNKAVKAQVKGCEKLQSTLGIKQNTSTVLQAALDETHATQKKVQDQKKALAVARRNFKTADQVGRKAVSNCRLRLAMLFGQEFNADWEKVGFPDRSTAVPESLEKRQALLLRLEKHFQSTPQQESQDMAATADACRIAWSQVNDSRLAVEKETKLRSEAVKMCNKARLMLKKRYRSLIVELGVLISPDDARWTEFGLNPPAREKRNKVSKTPDAEASPTEDTDDNLSENDGDGSPMNEAALDTESAPVPAEKTADETDTEQEAKPDPTTVAASPTPTAADGDVIPPGPRAEPAKTAAKRRQTAQMELLLPGNQPPAEGSVEGGSPEGDSPF